MDTWKLLAHRLKMGDKITVLLNDTATQLFFEGYHSFFVGRLGVRDKRPGIYHDRYKLRVRAPYSKATHTVHAQHLCVESAQKILSRKEHEVLDDRHLDRYVFQSELPATPFWEGDMVMMEGGTGRYMVCRIEYPEPETSGEVMYRVAKKLCDKYTQLVSQSMLLLHEPTEHGNVWKLYHQQKLVFEKLGEEEDFMKLVGSYTQTHLAPLDDHEEFSFAVATALKTKEADYALMMPLKGAMLLKYHCLWLGGLVRRFNKRQMNIL